MLEVVLNDFEITFQGFLVLCLGCVFILAAECTAGEPDGDVRLNGETLELVWTYDISGPINLPPLRVGDNVIVVPEKGTMLAINLGDGELAWESDPPQRVWDRAFTSDGKLIFVGIEGRRLVALNQKNGSIQWETELKTDVQAPPLVSGEVLYVPTTYVGPGLDATHLVEPSSTQ